MQSYRGAGEFEALLEESFRTLRSNLVLKLKEGEKSLLVSSAKPQEGKTTISVNLARSFAPLSEKVLLVDGDLRRPTLHKIFNVENEVGLSELLRGSVSLETVAQPISYGFSLVPSGELPRDPQELFLSTRFVRTLAEMERVFDLVILDSPPVLAVADAALIASHVDSVILVLKYGDTSVMEVLRAKERLQQGASTRIIGCVVNQFDGGASQAYDPYMTSYTSVQNLDKSGWRKGSILGR